MREDKFWEKINQALQFNDSVGISVVVLSKGSSPGKQGFKLVVLKNETFGTIGGGIMEAEIISRCKSQFNSNKKVKLHKMVHNKRVPTEEQSGLICSGVQIIATVILDQSDQSLINEILNSYQTKSPKWLYLKEDGISLESGDLDNNSFVKYFTQSNQSFEYRELIGLIDTVYVFGGGHVGSAVATQLSLLNFYVILIDNRSDLPRLPRVYDELILQDYTSIGKLINPDNYIRSYIVVVTSAMMTDIQVLKEVIHKPVKYIGLMGSKTKIKKIKSSLDTEGIDYSKINTPIGIPLNDETPQEIAVSIAAELINVKNVNEES